MNITLTRARKLSKDVLKTANDITLVPSVTVSMHSTDQKNTEIVVAAREKLVSQMVSYNRLMGVYTYLRKEIGKKNVEKGIHDLMVMEETIDLIAKKLGSLGSISSGSDDYDGSPALKDIQSANSALERMRNSATGYSSSVGVGILTDAVAKEITETLIANKRDRNAAADERTALNFTTQISLTQEMVDIVAVYGLL